MINLFLGKKNPEIEAQAKKLGFEKILFTKVIRIIKDFDQDTNSKNYDSCLMHTDNIENLRRFIDKASFLNLKVIVLGTSNEINRISLENKKVFALLDPDYERKKDFLDSRDSGLNQVLCKIARDNKKLILINLNNLNNSRNLGRTLHNFKLCKKFKTQIQLVDIKDNSSTEEMKSSFELKELERILKTHEHFDFESLKEFKIKVFHMIYVSKKI